MEYLSGRVTARSNVLQYERTLDTLKYIHTKAPFHRENESKSVLDFLNEISPEVLPSTPQQRREHYRRQMRDVIDNHNAVSREGFMGTGRSDADNPYDRNETIHDFE